MSNKFNSAVLVGFVLVSFYRITQGQANTGDPGKTEANRQLFIKYPGDEGEAMAYRYPPPTRTIQVVKDGHVLDTNYFSKPVMIDTPITAKWNSKPVVIAFYEVEMKTKHKPLCLGEDCTISTDVHGYVFVPTSKPDLYRRLFLGTFEQDGSQAEILSVFFVNADNDHKKEMAVLVRHAGTVHEARCDAIYEAYFYDDLASSNIDSLTPIPKINNTIGTTFECFDKHGNLHPELVDSLANKLGAPPYRNTREVKVRLKKLGY
jgi:hypothetical protein